MTVRTRFAPSPTGLLHIGGARTALFAWLFARKNQGQFILRIEDTDRERSTKESIDAILAGMAWLGLDYDEGPFYQTERFDRYEEVLQELLASGKAYRCTCSKERLTKLRETQQAAGEKPRYDGQCRDKNLAAGDESFVVRFRNPLDGTVAYEDQVYGLIEVDNAQLDDLILARSDGTPTYNFTVVVDDADMKITHVLRGDDHINNTPRQINLLKAIGANIPVYAHMPMILGENGKRLSKREGAASVLNYRDAGILPEALLNYLVRLGWAYGDQEIFAKQEMINYFELSGINRSPAALNHEKLLWLNQHYLKNTPREVIAPLLKDVLHALDLDPEQGPPLEKVVEVQAERCKTLNEIAEKSTYFFQEDIEYDAKARTKHLTAETLPGLVVLLDKFSAMEGWTVEGIHQTLKDTAEELNLKLGKLAQPLRVAVTGNTVSPSIDQTLVLIGKDRVIARLSAVVGAGE